MQIKWNRKLMIVVVTLVQFAVLVFTIVAFRPTEPATTVGFALQPVLREEYIYGKRLFVIGFDTHGVEILHTFFVNQGIYSVHKEASDDSSNFRNVAVGMKENYNDGRLLLHNFLGPKVFSCLQDRKGNMLHKKMFKQLAYECPDAVFLVNVKSRSTQVNVNKNEEKEAYQRIMYYREVQEFFRSFANRVLVFSPEYDEPKRLVNFLPTWHLNEKFWPISPAFKTIIPVHRGIDEQIPKRIIQTHRYKTVEDAPAQAQVVVNALRDAHDEWDYIYFNHDQARTFIAERMPTCLGCYDSINPMMAPARADLFRYIVIYCLGGVYLDFKSGLGPDTSLDDVLAEYTVEGCVLSWWLAKDNNVTAMSKTMCIPPERKHIRGEVAQWFVAASPGHPMLKSMIDICCARIRSEMQTPIMQRLRGKNGVLRLTGPHIWTANVLRFLRENGKSPRSVVNDAELLGLRYTVAGHFDSELPDHYSKFHTTPVVLTNDEKLAIRYNMQSLVVSSGVMQTFFS